MGNNLIKLNTTLLINEADAAKLDFEFFKNFESEHTRKSYRSDIRQFIVFFNNQFQGAIERVHIVAYRNWLNEKKLAPKTINRKLSSLSSYFDFLVEKGFMDSNPTTSVKRPKQVALSPTLDLSDEQVLDILNSVDDSSVSAKLHRAILYTLFSTGMRKSELINLKLKDYREINGHKVLEIMAKGGKFLQKVLHPECVEVIENYICWMESIGRKIDSDKWIFQPTKNPNDPKKLVRPLAPKSVDYIISVHCKKAGISERISPHSARATYIGSSLEAGSDLLTVSQDVGHSSVKTTEEYNRRRRKLKESPAYGLKYFKKSG
ncbi:MAG: hypothetical protein DRQ88_03825 [Epsilonproteobacteria bacterium]|nr:MAG: hypothetical protein DRQ89_04130 [Campylobacterota bacterium]RLA67167.1 MAG: hypothetical protein DRQ88_03825 [Campylobacterota bacterium]